MKRTYTLLTKHTTKTYQDCVIRASSASVGPPKNEQNMDPLRTSSHCMAVMCRFTAEILQQNSAKPSSFYNWVISYGATHEDSGESGKAEAHPGVAQVIKSKPCKSSPPLRRTCDISCWFFQFLATSFGPQCAGISSTASGTLPVAQRTKLLFCSNWDRGQAEEENLASELYLL